MSDTPELDRTLEDLYIECLKERYALEQAWARYCYEHVSAQQFPGDYDTERRKWEEAQKEDNER